MNRLLAIETSSEACSVALGLNGETLQRHTQAPLRHAELLLPAVHSLLDEADIELGSLDAIVFGRGPGSFASLRIGIGVVQGLAWGAGLPVVPVSSLAAVAQQVTVPGPDSYVRYVLVAMDARMAEVFHCSYELTEAGFLSPHSPESVSAPESVAVTSPQLTVGTGNGFGRYAELSRLGTTLNGVNEELLPCAAALIPLARQWLAKHDPLPPAGAQPVYIRDQVAEKSPGLHSAQAGVD